MDIGYDDDSPTSLDADAILHCLKFLAKQAASLSLLRTCSAIENALEAATLEGSIAANRHGLPHRQTSVH